MRRRHFLALAASPLLIAGCGFRLRGPQPLAFKRLLVIDRSGSKIGNEIKRGVQLGTDTKIVDDPKQAEAILTIDSAARGRQILSLNAQGLAREYRLSLTVSYRLDDPQGNELIAPYTQTLNRDITFSETAVLGKQDEEAKLYTAMEQDISQQILRRLAAVKPQVMAPAVPAGSAAPAAGSGAPATAPQGSGGAVAPR